MINNTGLDKEIVERVMRKIEERKNPQKAMPIPEVVVEEAVKFLGSILLGKLVAYIKKRFAKKA